MTEQTEKLLNGRRFKIFDNLKNRLVKHEKDFSTFEFRRVIDFQNDDGEIQKAVRVVANGNSKNGAVTFVPMKSLSFEKFSFPFGNNTKIREALKLQVMPYSAAGDVEIFPVVISKTGRNSEGLVWYVAPDELNIPGSLSEHSNNKIWPAPLGFVSQLKDYEGNGVTLWADEENLNSILWQNYIPVLSRWRKNSTAESLTRELEWYDSYCTAQSLQRGGTFEIIFASKDESLRTNFEYLDFGEIVNESVKLCPWISDVNLSRSALEGAMGLEKNLGFLTKAACWILAMGVIMLGAEIFSWQNTLNQTQSLRSRSERYYREIFDPEHTGRIANPVTLAREKINEAKGTGGSVHGLEEVLADFGEVFGDENLKNVTVDTVRYNSEGFDCTGSAQDMTTILNFRKAWESKATLAQLDNTQSVSGVGYRFDLRVRW